MPRKEIPAEMENLKQRSIETPPGTERSNLVKLYRFCEKLIS